MHVYHDEFKCIQDVSLYFRILPDLFENIRTLGTACHGCNNGRHNSLPFQGINNKNTSILIYFEKYAPIIMGYFYLTDKPIEYLDSLFNKLIYNYDELYVKGVLSGICDMEHFRSTLWDNGEYQYFQYMVDNGISMGSHYIK